MENQKTCFVIMGYGIKADYSTGRQLDLNKTYKNIIKPAVEEAGLICIRADELKHSGVIDVPMYRYLLGADVVIADLSTNNPNALYELGVRHALRPYTTIAISEKELQKPFDVDHTVIRRYEHLGKDIGYDEVMRFRSELVETIKKILECPETDSPVYTYLPQLTPPTFTIKDTIPEITEKNTLSVIVDRAHDALNSDDFDTAKLLFSEAHRVDSNNTYFIQKMVLCTYKSKKPDHITALNEALNILNTLQPESSTDPETLGLAGAINKRLWEELQDQSDLNKSIFFYEKGFYIKNDYYNGINLSFLLNVRAEISTHYDKIADYILANRIRKKVVSICKHLLNNDFEFRSDQYWILATLEEAFFGLGDQSSYEKIKEQAKIFSKENWERESTESQIIKLKGLLKDLRYLFISQ